MCAFSVKLWLKRAREIDPKEQASIFAALPEMTNYNNAVCAFHHQIFSSGHVIFPAEDETAKLHSLHFYQLPASHFPICLTRSQFGAVSSPSTYLHGLLVLLSTDTAIINHGKEYSWSRPRTEVGRLPACLPALEHRLKQRFHTDPRTPRSKEQARAAPADFLLLFSLILSSPSNQPALTGRPGSPPAVMSGW